MQDTRKAPTASKSSFAPIIDARTRLLVLGSLPGEISLARAQYYANPRNQFWRLMEAVTGCRLEAAGYGERLEALLLAGVGLWDVVKSGERVGSLDANIRNHQANGLAELAASLPNLRAIAFNGGKASSLGRKQLGPEPPYAVITLPSSSPAHAVPLEIKLAAWRVLAAHLDSPT